VDNVNGSITSGRGERFVGPASYWVDALTEVAGIGIDAFAFWSDGEDPIGRCVLGLRLRRPHCHLRSRPFA